MKILVKTRDEIVQISDGVRVPCALSERDDFHERKSNGSVKVSYPQIYHVSFF